MTTLQRLTALVLFFVLGTTLCVHAYLESVRPSGRTPAHGGSCRAACIHRSPAPRWGGAPSRSVDPRVPGLATPDEVALLSALPAPPAPQELQGIDYPMDVLDADLEVVAENADPASRWTRVRPGLRTTTTRATSLGGVIGLEPAAPTAPAGAASTGAGTPAPAIYQPR